MSGGQLIHRDGKRSISSFWWRDANSLWGGRGGGGGAATAITTTATQPSMPFVR